MKTHAKLEGEAVLRRKTGKTLAKLEGEAVLRRNTGKTLAKLEGGRLLPPDKEASFFAPLIAAGQTETAGLRTCRLGRQAASPGNPERWLGTGKAVFCNLAN